MIPLFLDFDRTLFDTDAFNASLPDEPGCAPFADILRATILRGRDETLSGGRERQRAWELVSDALARGDLSFPPGYLERFIFPDVPQVLRSLRFRVVIVTFGDVGRQQAKIRSALPDMEARVLYTADRLKAEALADAGIYDGGPGVFVDDRVVELVRCRETFPNLSLFEMRRDGKEGDGRFPVLRSLTELPVA